MLEGKNLVKSSSGRKIIDNINIELEPGAVSYTHLDVATDTRIPRPRA